jgi:hypothetical protein
MDPLSASGEEYGGELAALDPAHDRARGDVEMLRDISQGEPGLLGFCAGLE